MASMMNNIKGFSTLVLGRSVATAHNAMITVYHNSDWDKLAEITVRLGRAHMRQYFERLEQCDI